MEIACPACGKTNDLKTAAACARCGCELGRLAETLSAAANHLLSAINALRGGKWDEALRHSQRSWFLRHSSQAAQLAALASIATGDTQAFLRWRQRATSGAATPAQKNRPSHAK